MSILTNTLKPASVVLNFIRRSFGPGQANMGKTLGAAGVLSLAAFGTVCHGDLEPKIADSAQTSLAAMQDTRTVLGRINNEIRSSRRLFVGNNNGESFVQVRGQSLQQGNAVKIYPSGDVTQFVVYYVDPADQRLKRSASDSRKVEILADCVDRGAVFFGEDFLGNTVDAQHGSRVIRMTLQTHPRGSNKGTSTSSAKLCRLQTRMARRMVD